jgi:hypothetical protein
MNERITDVWKREFQDLKEILDPGTFNVMKNAWVLVQFGGSK